jgi:hypothetical protein
MFLGLPDPDPFERGTAPAPDPFLSGENSNYYFNTLIPSVLWLLYGFLSFKNRR